MENLISIQANRWTRGARLVFTIGLATLGLILLLYAIPHGSAARALEVTEQRDVSLTVSAVHLEFTTNVSRCFVGAYTYQVPPTGHHNTFVPGAMTLGIYQDLMEMPLAIYRWADDTWVPYLATSWEIVPPDRLTVNLRQGVKWSDGSNFTAQDVLDTFRVGRLMGWTVWDYLDRVEVSGTHTVNFYMAIPSTVVERYVLREQIRATSVYSSWATSLQALVDQGLDESSDEWQALLASFGDYRPTEMVVSGPFQIDASSVTEEELTLSKVPTAWNASQAKFDCIRIYNGEVSTIAPLVAAKEIDYATHGFPSVWETTFINAGIRILRPPIYSGPALYLNHAIYPFDVKEVRQSIAYAIDRVENGTFSLGDSGVAVEDMAGFSDQIVPVWLTDTTGLNRYPNSTVSATAVLSGLGFTRDVDGIWVTDRATRMVYTLTYPAEYADWSAAAQNLAAQLTTFGISTTAQGVPFWQHPVEVNQGNFQLAIRDWGSGDPHPYFSFVVDMFKYNIDAVGGPGMSFTLTQMTDCCGTIDLESEIIGCAEGLDEEAQKADVTRVALAFNELLPIIPLWERYGNNPALAGVRVIGWPQDSDPIYTNSPYQDSFVVIMMLDGTLRPSSAYTYLEPDTEGTLVYTDTQGSPTVIQVPARAVSDTTMLVYTAVETATAPSGFAFAGRAFDLTAYRNSELLSGFTFSKPVTVTIHYTDAEIVGVEEDTLELRCWNGIEWTSDGTTLVERNTAQNYVVFTITHLSEFALFGEYAPPTLSGLPNQIFDHSTSPTSTIDLWAYASDVQTPVDELTYTIEGTPPTGAGVTLDANRYVTVTPSTDWCGYTDVTIRATDPGGLWGTDTFRVAVTWSCRGPLPVANQYALQDESISLDLTAYEPQIGDGSAPLPWYVTGEDHCTVSGEYSVHDVLTFTPQAGFVGSDTVTLRMVYPWGSEARQGLTLTWGSGTCDTPGVPVLVAPVDGSAVGGNRLTFEWGAVTGADEYQIQVDDDADFSSPEREKTTASTEYTPASGLSGGVYYWRVRASNGCGTGSWSVKREFTVPTPSPLGFKLYLPVVGREYR